MAAVKPGDRVRAWPGTRDGRSYEATALTSVTPFGGVPCIRVQRADGGTDYIATTHIEPLGGVSAMTEHWGDVDDVLDAFDPSLQPRERAIVLCREIDRYGSLSQFLDGVSGGNFPEDLHMVADAAESALDVLSDAVTAWCAERGIEWP